MFTRGLKQQVFKTTPLLTQPHQLNQIRRSITTTLRKTPLTAIQLNPQIHASFQPVALSQLHQPSQQILQQSRRGYLFKFIRIMYRSVFPHPEHVRQANSIPDPYYGKYTPRRDPIPDGYWTQNPYGKPYFVGNSPEQEKLLQKAKDMKLYDGREHPWNPTREIDVWEPFTLGIPGKYFGYALGIFWTYLFWELVGERMKNASVNSTLRYYYLWKLDRFYPTNYLDQEMVEQYWPTFLNIRPRTALLPPVTDEEIVIFHTVESPEEKAVRIEEETAKAAADKLEKEEIKRNKPTVRKRLVYLSGKALDDMGITAKYIETKDFIYQCLPQSLKSVVSPATIETTDTTENA